MTTLAQKPTCGVCLDNPSKYKCPNCILPYCSLPCYKKHKATVTSKNDTTASTPSEDDSETALNPDQLRKLASSKIQEYLHYPQIRDLITQINSGTNPEALLDRAREDDPVFAEFAEEALAIVREERQGQEDGRGQRAGY
ncbi:hypothetical protein BC937DRAFT_93977 [Endogone sp. FLAS-F59071]|nr:hypothetical protein BC937DRAFT_93977 [Endogone sp. FLAS-F59071]|eukprot:RUS20956.1 hypothetical protein BC937DRAFT_93977 [Endogone sp. FLAS-F59071]